MAIPTNKISQVKLGQSITFHIDGITNKTFNSKITRINPTTTSNTNSINVYFLVKNNKNILKGGMFIHGNIITQEHKNSLSIPSNMLNKNSQGYFIYTVKDNRIIKHQVQIGLKDPLNNLVEIISGLKNNERVVALFSANLKSNTTVKVAKV